MTTHTLDVCQCNIIHQDVVAHVQPLLLSQDHAEGLASFFKVFSDPTRLRLLSALFHSEMCVCDLAASLNMTHSAISHQLRALKAAKLVKFRKVGKVVYYTLADEHIHAIFHSGLEHILE